MIATVSLIFLDAEAIVAEVQTIFEEFPSIGNDFPLWTLNAYKFFESFKTSKFKDLLPAHFQRLHKSNFVPKPTPN